MFFLLFKLFNKYPLNNLLKIRFLIACYKFLPVIPQPYPLFTPPAQMKLLSYSPQSKICFSTDMEIATVSLGLADVKKNCEEC